MFNEEIKARAQTNLVHSKLLMEMFQKAIKQYCPAAEFIEEQINISEEIVNRTAEELGMSEFEYAFYTAVAHKQSARE